MAPRANQIDPANFAVRFRSSNLPTYLLYWGTIAGTLRIAGWMTAAIAAALGLLSSTQRQGDELRGFSGPDPDKYGLLASARRIRDQPVDVVGRLHRLIGDIENDVAEIDTMAGCEPCWIYTGDNRSGTSACVASARPHWSES